jgi:hypothetical protein
MKLSKKKIIIYTEILFTTIIAVKISKPFLKFNKILKKTIVWYSVFSKNSTDIQFSTLFVDFSIFVEKTTIIVCFFSLKELKVY